ncbi:ATPase, P-type (transporting), HAD superfamily, subfamily IC [Thermosyntropha lipolytica DSM 11003]|uniref:ATPase, P-type (Transporting), HAD superfamily, subfamily IC n=1 Tax=Thermosyntropha lipolytica DSM 11003 TaxID=1123382 RepID=A0A1M5QBW1_9FIRM|nr:HAD family hydrolase [Thermosyntropha lipolytica]SHH11575.1 ATPase, P-type (transporting), HAD superfamily, subfamily IC [Thermosyntropha lipolytica DSM 11003]
MLQISIPGRDKTLHLKNILLDLNGTLTVNGVLQEGVRERIKILKNKFSIYLLTADTFGTGGMIAKELGIEVFKVGEVNGGQDKLDFLKSLGKDETVAIGNGFNDVLMLEEAALSIVIIGGEGCAVEALLKADIAVTDINTALDLLLNPMRLVATLRA